MTKTHKIILTILSALILVVIYITFDRKSDIQDREVADNSLPIATTSENIITQETGNYTIEQVPIQNVSSVPKTIPDLNREVKVYPGASITSESTAFSIPKIKSFQALLKNNPADFESWIYLGIYQKMAGDYEGAVSSWRYASKLVPTDHISLGNLGNIYAYFLKDNGQAEIYYKQAIFRGPNQAYLYIQLAEIYQDIFYDKQKAQAIVNAGLSKVPSDERLLQLKASLSNS